MHIRHSRFDKDILCFVVKDTTPQNSITQQLEKSGLGFAAFGEGVPHPFVVVDARDGRTEDELLAIEAHEVGHVMTGSTDEPTAELFAIALLRASGHPRAAQLLLNRGLVCKEDAELV